MTKTEPLDAAEAQNALPNVLPHQSTQKRCDELSTAGIRNAAVRLPTYAASRTTGVVPTPSNPGARAILLDELPIPTRDEIERHRVKFAPPVAHLRRGHDAIVRMTGRADEVYAKYASKTGAKAGAKAGVKAGAKPRRQKRPDQDVLDRLARAKPGTKRAAQRAAIIELRSRGRMEKVIAATVGVSVAVVRSAT